MGYPPILYCITPKLNPYFFGTCPSYQVSTCYYFLPLLLHVLSIVTLWMPYGPSMSFQTTQSSAFSSATHPTISRVLCHYWRLLILSSRNTHCIPPFNIQVLPQELHGLYLCIHIHMDKCRKWISFLSILQNGYNPRFLTLQT